jgi:hypothetical protein
MLMHALDPARGYLRQVAFCGNYLLFQFEVPSALISRVPSGVAKALRLRYHH